MVIIESVVRKASANLLKVSKKCLKPIDMSIKNDKNIIVDIYSKKEK